LKLKIGILGTRGIPNAYGGFEQFAEYLSVFLVKKGHDVSVYNSSLHPFKETTWNNVKIISRKDWEDKIGTAGQFIYDLNCILDSRKRNFDIILQLGYTSSSIWCKLLPNSSKIITNMDGMEWKRNKFSSMVQRFLMKAEKWAVQSSDLLVADSKGIQSYLQSKYQKPSKYIAYGAPVAPPRSKEILKEFQLQSNNYNLLVARMEPENNIETILDGHVIAAGKMPFIVVGKCENEFSKRLQSKYKSENNIRFIGGVYHLENLDCLRQNCNLYFHGHSVGGTNPSLLEAMGCGAYIIAHKNEFNEGVLEGNGGYFNEAKDVAAYINAPRNESRIKVMTDQNLQRIRDVYNWDVINQQYEDVMLKCMNGNV